MNKAQFTLMAVLGLFLSIPTLTAAQTDSRATWQTMKYGLFIHYVFGGEYGGMTPLSNQGGYPVDIDEAVDKFDVGKFGRDVKAMGFEYVVFTIWHANMGVLYPSKVMADYKFDQKDHYTSKRDLLGEIMDTLAGHGIKFGIYTHIWVGHDFHPNDGKSYYSYSNKSGIKTPDMINSGYVESVEGKPQKWNDFINKVYNEISTRYGEKVDAYWFDGTWTGVVDKKRLMETIKVTNKKAAFIANGDASHGMPYSAKEIGWSGPAVDMQKDYPNPTVDDKNVTTWPAYERSVALIQGNNWWAVRNGKARYSAEFLYRYTVIQAAANTGGGGVTWALSPYVDGSWEQNVLEYGKKVNSYINPIAESIKYTNPSKSYITPGGSKIATISGGFAATTSADGKYEYIHVLRPPAGKSIQLPTPKDGKLFANAFLLKNKKSVKMERNSTGYLLTLPSEESWDSLNTVIRLSMGTDTGAVPGKIQAESFADSYSAKIENCSDSGNGFNLGYLTDSSWLTYNIKANSADTFLFAVRAASQNAGGKLNVYLDGKSIEEVAISSTGGWQVWQTFTGSQKIPISKGTHSVKLSFSGTPFQPFNINWFSLQLASEVNPVQIPLPYTPKSLGNGQNGTRYDLLGKRVNPLY